MDVELEKILDNTKVYDLSLYMDYLFKEQVHLETYWKLRAAVDSASVMRDIRSSLDCCELYLEFSNIHSPNKPAEVGRPPVTALSVMINAIILYTRSVKSNSDYRVTFNIRSKLIDNNKTTHDQVCDLRDKAIAHYGPGKLDVENLSFSECLPLLIIDPESPYIKISTSLGNIGLSFSLRFKELLLQVLEISKTRSKQTIGSATEALFQHFTKEGIYDEYLERFRFDYIKHEGSREAAALRLSNRHNEWDSKIGQGSIK